MKHRVVVTGMGIQSPLGDNAETFFSRLCAGESGIRAHPELAVTVQVGWVDFSPSDYFSKIQLRQLDRVSQLAIVAATAAAQDAGLDTTQALGETAGVYFGTSAGGAESTEHAYAKFFGVGGESKKLLTVPAAMVHAPASQVALRLGVQGECQTYSTACSSASVAIGEAFRRIQGGHMQIAIAGGADCMLTPGVLDSWADMRVLCSDPLNSTGSGCRPFSANRSGFAIGEGAAVFVLETDLALEKRIPC